MLVPEELRGALGHGLILPFGVWVGIGRSTDSRCGMRTAGYVSCADELTTFGWERRQTRPPRTAAATAAARLSTPSLLRMLVTCVVAVRRLMNSASAISRSV
jgi:hypothetical protein